MCPTNSAPTPTTMYVFLAKYRVQHCFQAAEEGEVAEEDVGDAVARREKLPFLSPQMMLTNVTTRNFDLPSLT